MRPVTSAPVFEFHSGFWLNLHHFLYREARAKLQLIPATTPGEPTDRVTEPARAGKSPELTPQERTEWDAAVEYYAANLARRDLLFDGDMLNIKNRLAEMENQPGLENAGLRYELVQALEKAAPVYRARWWQEHDRANRTWAQEVTPLVQKLGLPLAQQLSTVYQEGWPEGKIAVDLATYAGRVGGYTSLDPLRVTISSTDPRNQGAGALELLFHEASHGMSRSVAAAIARECQARKKPIPRELWHALLFYTTGEMVRRALAKEPAGSPDYTPYAIRQNLYARGWQSYWALLERYWQPYLDGKADIERAISRMVGAL
jgi:hypothetical protein